MIGEIHIWNVIYSLQLSSRDISKIIPMLIEHSLYIVGSAKPYWHGNVKRVFFVEMRDIEYVQISKHGDDLWTGEDLARIVRSRSKSFRKSSNIEYPSVGSTYWMGSTWTTTTTRTTRSTPTTSVVAARIQKVRLLTACDLHVLIDVEATSKPWN